MGFRFHGKFDMLLEHSMSGDDDTAVLLIFIKFKFWALSKL